MESVYKVVNAANFSKIPIIPSSYDWDVDQTNIHCVHMTMYHPWVFICFSWLVGCLAYFDIFLEETITGLCQQRFCIIWGSNTKFWTDKMCSKVRFKVLTIFSSTSRAQSWRGQFPVTSMRWLRLRIRLLGDLSQSIMMLNLTFGFIARVCISVGGGKSNLFQPQEENCLFWLRWARNCQSKWPHSTNENTSNGFRNLYLCFPQQHEL